MSLCLPNFLPGELVLGRGSRMDYLELEQFHYIAKRPATWADVWVIRYRDRSPDRTIDSRIVAVGVLSYPVPNCAARERYFRRSGLSRTENLIFANRELRTISRVIVHPQFRSLGLASILVQALCAQCPTRYVETMAVMARAHPLFIKAGMQQINPKKRDEPVYFILDRKMNSALLSA